MLALETDTTLKNLVTEGLEMLLLQRRKKSTLVKPDPRRLPKVRPKGDGLYSLSPTDIDRILAEEEAASYGRNR